MYDDLITHSNFVSVDESDFFQSELKQMLISLVTAFAQTSIYTEVIKNRS